MPPAELFDIVLRESAYAFELRGPRLDQARENLKKLRALMRRMQNRGYLTLPRLVAHLDRLAVGDESNAAIDASDAVNLMTIHAAKGLEFPVVFVVNMSRGTGNRRPPMRVAIETGGAEASVSIGDFQSEADEDRQAKEREETKRLLYVALTRARDRLYLSSLLKDGAVPKSAGSLAEVLPPGLLACFAGGRRPGRPSRGVAIESGRTHHFAVCPPAALAAGARAVAGAAAGAAPVTPRRRDDLAPLDAGAGSAASAAVVAGSTADGRGGRMPRTRTPCWAPWSTGCSSASACPRPSTTSVVLEAARPAVRPADNLAPPDLPAVVARAAELYLRARQHPAGGGHLRLARDLARGAVLDGRRRDASCAGPSTASPGPGPAQVTVLEFKTGRPRDWHEAQLRLYRRAVERLFPGDQVRAELVYVGQAAGR